MASVSEQEVLVKAIKALQDLIADEETRVVRDAAYGDGGRDDVWRIETPHLNCDIAVQAYSRFTPKDADRIVSGVSQLMRSMRDQPILVVAPWLSPRSRELLIEQRINYLDLTGNARVRIPRLPIVVRTDGAQNDPTPVDGPRRGLQGKLINSLVRVLVDFAPPYRMSDLARASDLSPAYVSRTLAGLDEERLIERGRNRMVVDVDWQRLLRERARNYKLIKSNRGRSYITRTGLSALTRALPIAEGTTGAAPGDADGVYRRLIDRGEDRTVVTGSFAAQDYVQIAAPTQLVLYVRDVEQFVSSNGLMPADRGANVLLLQPADRSQLERIRLVEGTFQVGLSQLALDCLSGNGRLPEEGEALLEWMSEHVGQWRQHQLPER